MILLLLSSNLGRSPNPPKSTLVSNTFSWYYNYTISAAEPSRIYPYIEAIDLRKSFCSLFEMSQKYR